MSFELSHSNGIHIPHFSASTITSFISNRTSFYSRKVDRKPFVPNKNMVRGMAVEDAINGWVNGDDADHRQVALDAYLDKLATWISQHPEYSKDDDEIYQSLPALVDAGIAHYQEVFDDFNQPRRQDYVSARLEGVEREVIGYCDYATQKEIRDLKVTGRSPSKISQNYVIQGALYRQATGLPVYFDYIVCNKKPKVVTLKLTDEEFSFGIRYAKRAAETIEEMQSCENPARMMKLMAFPDLSAIWDEDERFEVRKDWDI